jgi:hypothetical protein
MAEKQNVCENLNAGYSYVFRAVEPYFGSGKIIVGDCSFVSVHNAVALHAECGCSSKNLECKCWDKRVLTSFLGFVGANAHQAYKRRRWN